MKTGKIHYSTKTLIRLATKAIQKGYSLSLAKEKLNLSQEQFIEFSKVYKQLYTDKLQFNSLLLGIKKSSIKIHNNLMNDINKILSKVENPDWASRDVDKITDQLWRSIKTARQAINETIRSYQPQLTELWAQKEAILKRMAEADDVMLLSILQLI